MTDKELYELVRENYNKANKEYLNEQMHKACKSMEISCFKCHGKGEVPMTNEEWFCSLPTKEKAKEMCVIMADMAEANDGVWDEEMIEEWLKEVHKE